MKDVEDRRRVQARGAARRMLVQALYQWQLGRQPAEELVAQFSAAPDFARVDHDYFREAISAIVAGSERIDEELRLYSDIQPERLDPIEHAILSLGLWELMTRLEVPFRVVINEGVELAKRFGATDGYRYVNAVLDRASRAHRSAERGEVA